MKKELKIGALIVAVIALIIISALLYKNGYVNYLIVTATLLVVTAIALFNLVITNRSEESIYNSKLRQILKTYDSILVKSKNLPKLDEKNIIRVDSIEDLVDAQVEIRKPIYFQEQTESCAFILLDNKEACIYILKLNNDVLSPVEIILNELDIKHKQAQNKDEIVADELLKDIDKTTIVRVNKGKYVKVSPIRKNKEKKDEQKEEAPKQEAKEEPKKEEAPKQEVKEEPKKEEAPKQEAKEEPKKEEAPKIEVKEEPKKEEAPKQEAKEEPKKEENKKSTESVEKIQFDEPILVPIQEDPVDKNAKDFINSVNELKDKVPVEKKKKEKDSKSVEIL